jgi:SAM-dependent methyltransferase
MSIAETLLYRLARTMYKTEVAHSAEMKEALQGIEKYDRYRSAEIDRILLALQRFAIDITGKTVIDFGCNDGAISAEYMRHGARRVIGFDVDATAVSRAREVYGSASLEFHHSSTESIPLADATADVIISYDVFEHVSRPEIISRELYRVLTPRGVILIGTWGWRHPFAPHLWAVMPVPWAHLIVSERTLLRASRRVYEADWYRPNMYDVDSNGRRIPDKYTNETLSREYLNQYLIRDFERTFRSTGFDCTTIPVPFGSAYAGWTKPLLRLSWARELFSGYVWFILRKPESK